MEAILATFKNWPFFLLAFLSSITNAEHAPLASSPQWRALLHYQTSPYPFSNNQFSQIADSHFFLAANGNRNPEAELQANLQALQSIKCRFPARALWLAENFGQQISLQDCRELNSWLDKFTSDEIYLHFPASYLNNPSSVFGHTFLRLHKKGRSPLLDPVINYAAISNTNNPLSYMGRGLAGAFPGIFALHPHYLKKREYTVTENREIWSYKVNLSEDEINRFLLHFWEIKDRQFNYYFLNQNCSYQLLALLDVAIQDLSLLNEFHNVALPIDTIKFLDKHQRVTLTDFHPSFVDAFREEVSQLTKPQRQQVLELTQCPAREASEITDGRVLRLSSDYLEYLIQQDLRPRDCAHQQMAKLQNAMQQYNNTFVIAPLPEKGPESSHPRSKVGLGYHTITGSRFNFRLGYHDLLDPAVGFKIGQEVILGELSYDIDRHQVANYQLIGLQSLSSSDEFFDPISWTFNVNGRRYGAELDSAMHHQLSLGLGKARSTDDGLIFAKLDTSLSYNQDTSTDLVLTPTLGHLYRANLFNSSVAIKFRMPVTDWQQKLFLAESRQTVNVDNDLQVSFSAQWIYHQAYKQGNIALSLNYLF